MSFAETLLPEYEHEMQVTRTMLERVPMEKYDWRPHTKSTSLGALASHLATLAGFGVRLIKQTEVNMAPEGGPPRMPPQYRTREDLLDAFDKNVAASREAIQSLEDSDLRTLWSLKMGAQTIFSLPRAAAIRTMMMSHIIHHRGQLSVYLRLNDVPLPAVYGPTADS
jgi:uncharacterized damage-inducible protein DinB